MALVLNNAVREQLIRLLKEEGHPSYAPLLALCDVYLTDDPEVVAYMIPKKAVIVINRYLAASQASVIVRHELLHEFFTHYERELKFCDDHPELQGDHELANIAGDFHISNYYTNMDKAHVRAIRYAGKTVRGLVVEDHYPEWKGKSFEEMYELLLRERKKDSKELQQLIDRASQLSKRDLDEMRDQLDELEDEVKDASGTPQEDSQSSTDSQAKSSNPSQDGEEETDSTSATSNGNEAQDSADDTVSAEESDDATKDALDKIDKAEATVDKAEKAIERHEDSGTSKLMSPLEQRDLIDVTARAKKLQDMLRNGTLRDSIIRDITKQQRDDIIRRAKADAVSDYARTGSGGLENFKVDLRRFVSRLVGDKERSYKTFDPRYEGSGFIMPGKYRSSNKTPVINVYWDSSGSFSDPAKTAGARAAIETIRSYVKQGLISIHVYFHSNTVTLEPQSGGNNGNEVMKHIQETKPDNVIIITDGDLSGTNMETEVPGAVWMLFYDYTSAGLIKNLHGRKETRWYMIDYK